MPLPGQTLGEVEIVTVNPAAGSDVVYVADADMLVHSIKFVLTTSAVAATRQPYVSVDDGTTEFFRIIGGGVSQVASTTNTYSCIEGRSDGIPAGIWPQLGLPPNGIRLRKGDRIVIGTFFKDAGDDFTSAVLQVERLGAA
jgi:hypothetical protein